LLTRPARSLIDQQSRPTKKPLPEAHDVPPGRRRCLFGPSLDRSMLLRSTDLIAAIQASCQFTDGG